jgi:hypothetical protein
MSVLMCVRNLCDVVFVVILSCMLEIIIVMEVEASYKRAHDRKLCSFFG